MHVPVDLIRAKRTAGAAFRLALDTSGLEDKEVYMALGIDAGTFSKIKTDKATLQAELVASFCRIVGNNIYLEWQAFQVGCTLVMLKSEAERLAEHHEKRARDLQMKVDLLTELMVGRTSGNAGVHA